MQTISFIFLIFMSLLVVGYYVVPSGFRYLFLLACNVMYYLSWTKEIGGIIPIASVAFISYIGARILDKKESSRVRKCVLLSVCLACLGQLLYFKYFNFLFSSVCNILHIGAYKNAVAEFDIIAPIGISFFTFQALSYVIEVYRKNVGAERNFALYATYLSFFPIVLSGPIERPDRLLSQMKEIEKIKFSFSGFQSGLTLILWGGCQVCSGGTSCHYC